MRTVPRPKRPRDRVASAAELADDRRRCLAAKPRIFATVEEFERFAATEPPTRETIAAERQP